MLSADCRRWNAASAGASDGRIGRMCAVSPSPSTTSLAQRSSGSIAMTAMMPRVRGIDAAVAGVTVGWVLLELDLDDLAERWAGAGAAGTRVRATHGTGGPAPRSLPSWSRIVATSARTADAAGDDQNAASNELASPVHVTNGGSTTRRSAETVTSQRSSIGPASQCVDAVRPRSSPPAASSADPVELVSTQRGRSRRIHAEISG